MTQPLLPLFDTLANLADQTAPFDKQMPDYCLADYQHAKTFLLSYNGSQGTFNAYRREIERALHWAWQVMNKSIRELRRVDIEQYLHFCQQPPVSWISVKRVPRFILNNGLRVPNPLWRPFVVTVSKSAYRQGLRPHTQDYTLSETALKEIFAILSSFYNFLIQEEACDINPRLNMGFRVLT